LNIFFEELNIQSF